jgi:glutaconate CoA-transferase subunit A
VTTAGHTRRGKLATLDAAASLIRDGDHVAIGGIWSHNCPSALVRAVIRSGVKDLTLSAGPAAGYPVDLLIAAGCVRRAMLPNVTFEHLGLAPGFRRAVQSGAVELIECDEPSLVGGYRAAAAGLPSQPVRSLRGTDLLRARPDLRARSDHGREVLDVPAVTPDVVLLHAAAGDRYGNLRQRGSIFADKIMAKAARRAVVASLDGVVDNDEVRRQPAATTVASYLVTHVIEVPFGAHPCSSHSLYADDEPHLRRYVAALGDRSERRSYWDAFVLAPTHDAYLIACGGVDALTHRLGTGSAK